MQITLVETELREALQNYLSTLMTIPKNKKFEMEFQATRGANGFSAIVNIVDTPTAASAATKVSVKVAEDTISGDTIEPEVMPQKTVAKKSLFASLP